MKGKYTIMGAKGKKLKRVAVAFICDENFAMPTCVAIASLIQSREMYTHYVVYVVTTGLKQNDLEKIKSMAEEHVEIHVSQVAIDKYAMFEETIRKTKSNVSTAALLKFDLPSIVHTEQKLLYLDGDILVKKDLADFYMTDIEDYYVGAVLDSSSMYTQRKLPVECPTYFNSGVMLLNLQKMRENGITDKLIQTKQELSDISLMDQNVLNIVMVNHIKIVPILYNFMYTNLARAKNKYTMEQLNEMFGTNFKSLAEIKKDAAIIHFASKDKPWKDKCTNGQDEWFQVYNSTPYRSVLGCNSYVKPMVSIVITDTKYSTTEHLMQTLKSIAMQPYEQYEIVLVSSIVTQAQLEGMIGKNHITLVQPTSNHKNLCFRQGVETARGKYVLWLECGNTLMPESLEKAKGIFQASSAPDVIYYNIKVDNLKGFGNYVNLIEKGTNIPRGTYDKESIWKPISKNGYSYPVLWNALTNRNVCCQMFKLMTEDIYEGAAFDIVAVCLRNILAVSSIGTQIPMFEYHFNSNRDVRNQKFDNAWFEKALSALEYEELFTNICSAKVYCQAIDYMRFVLVKYWVKQVPEIYGASAFDMMLDKMGVNVVSVLAERFSGETGLIARKLTECKFIEKGAPKDIKNIGLFFHNIFNGGIQRVVVQLAKIFRQNGYGVVVFTDDQPVEGEYPLPEGVIRHALPDRRIYGVNAYNMRALDLTKALKDYHIDLFVNNAWTSNTLLWDTMVIKIAGVKVVSLAHNVSALWFSEGKKQPWNKSMIYQLQDGVITLSRVEEEFFSQFTFARYIPNPCSFDNLESITVSPLSGNNILWLARMDQRKNPEHLMNAFLRILERVPDATISYVGGGDDKLMDTLSRMAQWYGVEDKVEFAGFTLDVEQYYRKASVFVMTSYHEGYPMTLIESKAYGVPAVVYDMPYLEMLRENKGMTIVKRDNISELSDAIVDMLINRKKLKQMGHEARKSIEPISDNYIMQCWKQVFEAIQKEQPPIDLTKRIMLENIMEYHEKGVESAERLAVKKASEKVTSSSNSKDYWQGISEVRASKTYLVGRVVTWLPKQIRAFGVSLTKNGLRKTVVKVIKKIGKLPKAISKFVLVWKAKKK